MTGSQEGMGLCWAEVVREMTDDGRIVSLRMGTEDLQVMDNFLERHPEFGGRSLFIRTVIRQYIDRYADAPPKLTNKNEVVVKMSMAELETIDSMIDDGIYVDRSDAVRSLIRSKIVNDVKLTELAQSKYAATTTSL